MLKIMTIMSVDNFLYYISLIIYITPIPLTLHLLSGWWQPDGIFNIFLHSTVSGNAYHNIKPSR